MFHRIVVGTLQIVGCDVIDIGLTTTPGCQLAVEHHHAAGGVMLSASHNPIEWNALKLIGSAGLFLEASQGAAMRGLLETGVPRATWDRIGSVDDARIRGCGAARAPVLAIPYIDVEAIRRRRFKVALDCVRGAGATMMPALLTRSAARWWRSTWRRTVSFPRAGADPGESLGARSAREGKRRGHRLAVDPDVDRLAIVSDEGRAIGEDYTLALAAKLVLRHRRGPVVTNLSTSLLVEDIASEAGSSDACAGGRGERRGADAGRARPSAERGMAE